MKPTVLFLFNSSLYALEPWLSDGGFNVVTVDYSETDHSGHREETQEGPQAGHVGLWRFSVDLSRGFRSVAEVEHKLTYWGLREPSFVVSFAPCTDLAVSGAKHFERKRKENPFFQCDAVAMARLVEYWDCPSVVENPVSVLSTLWKPPTGYVHPWEFSWFCPKGPHPEAPGLIPERDLYTKKTGLWCQNGAVMPLKLSAVGDQEIAESKDNPGFAKLGGKSAKTKHLRSLTPRGLSWGLYYANVDLVKQWSKEP